MAVNSPLGGNQNTKNVGILRHLSPGNIDGGHQHYAELHLASSRGSTGSGSPGLRDDEDSISAHHDENKENNENREEVGPHHFKK